METMIVQGSVYKGYTLWKREIWGQQAVTDGWGKWGAYTPSEVSRPWFEAATPEELVKKIDEAHAELPEPVY